MKIKLPTIALAALLFAGLPLASSSAFVAVSVGIAPPPIPVYQQPFCPAPGYIWTPGYWAYADFGYYWAPGVWVRPPRIGFLWTPGYWGYRGGSYLFNQGYWGPTVGFYGGINYGYGYIGHGYYGGEWAGGTFRYNTAVTRVNTNVIKNVYVNKTVLTNSAGNRAAFNGPGGVQANPNAREQAAANARHVAPTSAQRSVVEASKKNPALHAANNKGQPKAEAINAVRNQVRPSAEAGAAARTARGRDRAGANGQVNDTQRTRAGQANAGPRAASDNGARANRAARNPERTGLNRGENRSVQRANRSRANRAGEAAAANRSSRAAAARRGSQRAHSAVVPRRGVRPPQAAPRRTRGPAVKQSAQNARGRGPAQEAPQNRKKRKKAQQGPEGQ